MEIKGTIHCFFEQSGTFRDAFRELGYAAYDYDIDNTFGKTDYQMNLFRQIDKAYFQGMKSIFDEMLTDDLIIAFFPCIYFCDFNRMFFTNTSHNYKNYDEPRMLRELITRNNERSKYYNYLLKLCCVVVTNNLRLIIENPYTGTHYLKDNFPYKPAVIDFDRRMRGDYYKKPTQYIYVNCQPTYGESLQYPKETKTIKNIHPEKKKGQCNIARSMISPDYARNFICDFIIGKTQNISQLGLFDNLP